MARNSKTKKDSRGRTGYQRLKSDQQIKQAREQTKIMGISLWEDRREATGNTAYPSQAFGFPLCTLTGLQMTCRRWRIVKPPNKRGLSRETAPLLHPQSRNSVLITCTFCDLLLTTDCPSPTPTSLETVLITCTFCDLLLTTDRPYPTPTRLVTVSIIYIHFVIYSEQKTIPTSLETLS